MGININEIKTVLRSILISSSVVINVVELNNDFREQEGREIPYKELGFNSLIDFLKSIPDVLLVDGNTCYSEVILVESAKSAHVNDLVMKQKVSRKPGSFYTSTRRQGTRRKSKNFCSTSNSQKHEAQNEKPSGSVISDDRKCDQKFSSYKSNKRVTHSTNKETIEKTCHQTEKKINNIPEKNSLSIDLNQTTERLISDNKNLENTSNNNIKEISGKETVIEGNTKLLRRINYNDSFLNIRKTDDSFDRIVDLSFKSSRKPKIHHHWRGGTIGSSYTKHRDEYFSVDWTLKKTCIEGSSSMPSSDETKNSCYDLYLAKNSWQKNNVNSSGTGKQRVTYSNIKNRNEIQHDVPKKVQCDLQRLISVYPEGIWCTELPSLYKNFTGQELCFTKFGYRYLSYMCFDLENIFHCIKASSCDYKLFDARKPLPEIKPEQSVLVQSTQDSKDKELPPTMPEISWSGYDCFLPKDVVRLGYKMERIQVADVFKVGISVKVVVAEIYDISKFWIYLDDSKLQTLMREMQNFYQINRRKLIPHSLLADGLYCVVLYRGKFHRAVILNVMINEDYVKVNYIDYGTLGKVSKSEIWFMTPEFGKLPSQAIRARLADIYPPHEGVTWSPFANYDFTKFTSMKKLTAEIVRIDVHKNFVEIKLKNSHGTSISDILVDLKYALFINETRKKHIKDPNCECKVKFIHLFPTFEEIENWVAPSLEEATDFLDTSITADFIFAQYFTKKVNTDLINSVEEKMKVITKKRKSLIKHIKSEDLLSLHGVEEMNKIVYGVLYNLYEKKPEVLCDLSTTKTEAEILCEIDDLSATKTEAVEEVVNETESKKCSLLDIGDDETLARMLRQSRMKKLYSFEGERFQEGVKDIVDELNSKHSKNSTLQRYMKEKEGNSHSNSRGFLKTKTTYDKVSEEFLNVSELEKYLTNKYSDMDASIKSSSNMIDLDNENISSLNPVTNLLLCSEFEQSFFELARSRKICQNCLLTENVATDMEKGVLVNPLDLPIPCTTNVASIPSDLIQFDEDELVPDKNSDSEGTTNSINIKPIFNVGSGELNDADDEDSDDKQDYVKYSLGPFHLEESQNKFSGESTKIDCITETSINGTENSAQMEDQILTKYHLTSDILNKGQKFVGQDNCDNIKEKNIPESLLIDLIIPDNNNSSKSERDSIKNCEFKNLGEVSTSNITVFTDQIIQGVPIMVNISELTDSSSKNSRNCVTSQLTDQDKNFELFKSTISELNDKTSEDSPLSNMSRMRINSDMKTYLGSFQVNHQSIKEKKHLSSVSNTKSISSNSIVTIDSSDFYDSEVLETSSGITAAADQTTGKDLQTEDSDVSPEIMQKFECQSIREENFSSSNCSNLNKTSSMENLVKRHITKTDLKNHTDDMIDLNDNEYMIHESSSSTNLYYSCESKNSSLPDTSCESFDYTIFSNNYSVESSTPLQSQNDLTKDNSFLEEFDIIDISPTLSPNSDRRSEEVASNHSVLSGEWRGLNLAISTEMSEESPDLSQSTESKGSMQQFASDVNIEGALRSSCDDAEENEGNSTNDNKVQNLLDSSSTSNMVDNRSETPLSLNNANMQVPFVGTPQFPYLPNDIHQSRMISTTPPPGFPTIPPPIFPTVTPSGVSTVLVTNAIRYSNGFVPPNIPMHCFPSQQQELVAQVTQHYRTYPIVVVNYNFAPPLSQNGTK